MAKQLDKVLTDSLQGIYQESWRLESASLPGFDGPPWSITKFVLRGGKQHGVDVVELDNGSMCVSIVPTRGMNVLKAVCDGIVLGWNSPVKEEVHPAYVQAESRGGLGWAMRR